MLLSVDVLKSPFDIRDYSIKSENSFPIKYSCPVAVPIKDQGLQSTCVAHAAASLVEYHNFRQYGEFRTFSTEFIYGLREDGYYVGDGMVIRDALKTLVKYGDPYSTDCSGNSNVKKAIAKIEKNRDDYIELAYPHRISAYYKCSSIEEIKTALIKHGPVLASMNTYKGAKLKNDIYSYNPQATHGRHCIMIYGYDERGWLIQNSWGLLYGGDGRFVIPFDFAFNEAWGVTDNIIDENLKIKNQSKFMNFIYKTYNLLINFWINFTNRT